MLNNDLSDGLKKQVEKIIKKIGPESCIANIEMEFTSPKFPEYKVYLCREIEELKIHQDFVLNITDKITAELRMERDPYIGMLYMRKNMNCQLTITFTHPDRVVDNNEYKRKPDYSSKFKVMVTKWEDLFKKMSTEQLFPEKRRENDHDRKTFLMSVELLAEDVYKARKESLYFTGRDTNMSDMMRYCINYFGFTKAYYCAPDNSKPYTNFVIPPSYGVEEIMSFLQNAPGLGIYNDGLISYIMNGCWYIYPRYGEPVNKCPIMVYCLGGQKFAGMNRNDWEEGNQTVPPATGKFPLHIISPSEMKEKSYISEGSENLPTSYIAQMSDLIIDASRTLVNDNKTILEHRTNDPSIVPPDVMDYENFSRIKYIKSKCNIFRIKSEVRSMQTRILSFHWKHARPWTFQPATVVYVFYDDHAKLEQAIGMAEKVTYTFTRDSEKSVLFPRWTCDADIDVNASVRGEGLLQSQR